MAFTPLKPIASQQEAKKVMDYLVTTTANTLRIPIDEAKRRVAALLASGLMEGGHPEDPLSQAKIDMFLAIPSSTYAHLL